MSPVIWVFIDIGYLPRPQGCQKEVRAWVSKILDRYKGEAPIETNTISRVVFSASFECWLGRLGRWVRWRPKLKMRLKILCSGGRASISLKEQARQSLNGDQYLKIEEIVFSSEHQPESSDLVGFGKFHYHHFWWGRKEELRSLVRLNLGQSCSECGASWVYLG